MDVIKSSTDITLLFAEGRRVRTSNVTLIVLEHRDRSNKTGGRVAFIAGKKQGNSVWRNRARRRMRAVCHELGGPWPGYDVGFMAKGSIAESLYKDIVKDCRYALSKAGVIEKEI